MSRHSKWSKVKQFKGAIDAKRSASFTKLSREITVAARDKGTDPNMNVALRVAIDRAKKASLPKDSIDRALARAAGVGEEKQIDSLTYEAYAPGGTAMIIECLTDNHNRSASDVKHILSKGGGTLASAGSVKYLFDRYGVVRVGARPASPSGMLAEQGEARPSPLPDYIELALIDAGAEDIVVGDDSIDVRSAPNELAKVTDAVQKLGLNVESAEFEWVPKTLVETDEATGTSVAELIDELDSHDDVSRVFSNLA